MAQEKKFYRLRQITLFIILTKVLDLTQLTEFVELTSFLL